MIPSTLQSIESLRAEDWFINILDLSAADSPETWSQTVRMLRLLRLPRDFRCFRALYRV